MEIININQLITTNELVMYSINWDGIVISDHDQYNTPYNINMRNTSLTLLKREQMCLTIRTTQKMLPYYAGIIVSATYFWSVR